MESGSSGSFQSSSGGVGGGGGGGGGDEEYDSSRGEYSQPQLFLSHHQQEVNPFFHPSSDHHSQNLDASLLFLQNANFQQKYNNNEKMGWSRGFVRSSESNYGNFGNFSLAASGASSLPFSTSQHLIGTQGGGMMMINQTPLPDSLLHSGGGSGGVEAINIPNNTAANNQPPPPPPPDVVSTNKSTTNPKKRTRASRRAPTTVLTTDTNNFRQMVQEFTGIPDSPFSANPGSSSFGRRLDHMSPFYPLRPSAKKLTPSSSSSSSLLSSSLMMNAIGNPNSNNPSISNNTLVLPQQLKQSHPHENIVSMQNQLLSFQPPIIFNNTATRPHHEGSSSMNILPSLDELGGFINQQRSSGGVERLPSWRDDQGGRNLNNEGQDGQHQLGSTFEGNDTQDERNIHRGFKLNSSFTSDFNPDKVLDNNASSSGGVEFPNYK